jgi:ribosomal protein S6
MENLKTFETIMILGENTTVKELNEIKKEIEKIITITSGSFDFEDLGFKKLAYEVKGNTEGQFIQYRWNGTSLEDTLKLQKYIEKTDAIIKFITIRVTEEDLF